MTIVRQALKKDLKLIMEWIPDETACRIWAGPGFRFPFTWKSFIEDLGFPVLETYVLENASHQIVGLGQIIHRENRLHLARILVHPELRGQGYGRQLCEKLMRRGSDFYGKKEFSLNVYRQNATARRLYESLGYVIAADQSTAPSPDSIFMIRSA